MMLLLFGRLRKHKAIEIQSVYSPLNFPDSKRRSLLESWTIVCPTGFKRTVSGVVRRVVGSRPSRLV